MYYCETVIEQLHNIQLLTEHSPDWYVIYILKQVSHCHVYLCH
jgi:hypothetical protein